MRNSSNPANVWLWPEWKWMAKFVAHRGNGKTDWLFKKYQRNGVLRRYRRERTKRKKRNKPPKRPSLVSWAENVWREKKLERFERREKTCSNRLKNTPSKSRKTKARERERAANEVEQKLWKKNMQLGLCIGESIWFCIANCTRRGTSLSLFLLSSLFSILSSLSFTSLYQTPWSAHTGPVYLQSYHPTIFTAHKFAVSALPLPPKAWMVTDSI